MKYTFLTEEGRLLYVQPSKALKYPTLLPERIF